LASPKYYYFASTLPFVNYGDKPPKSSVEFQEECYSLLDPKDAALIPYCSYNSKLAVETLEPTGSDYVDLFLLQERTLVLNLAYLRAARLKFQAPAEPPQEAAYVATVAKTAIEIDDPLQAMLYIDKSRWNFLDAMLRLDDMFGVNVIFDHVLKLQLLERKQVFDTKKGLEQYQKCYNAILDEYNAKL